MIKRILKNLLILCLCLFIFSIAIVVVFRFAPVPYTPLMLLRLYEQKSEGKEMVLKHEWVPIEEISIHLQKAVIASEDGFFLKHHGFDIEAIKKAMKNNEAGNRIKGASTISQQTAKNVFLWPGRSYFRKGLEAYFTVLIELIWGKQRIMEVYLNSIEMGNGVYGAQEASHFWFKKDAKKLSPYEAAAIAAILPNPRKYKATNSSSYINDRKETIMQVMNTLQPIVY
jgi:monofunctional glycosyltransferase